MSRARRARGGSRAAGVLPPPIALATLTADGTWRVTCPYCCVAHEHADLGVVVSDCRKRSGPYLLIADTDDIEQTA